VALAVISTISQTHQHGSNNAKERAKREECQNIFITGCYRPCVWSFYSIILCDKSIGSRRNISGLFRTILYIGAANLLPETYRHTAWKMAVAMIIGVLLIFVLTSLY